MVVITGYYANLIRSVKTETMARGTRGPVCGNQWSPPQSSMKKGPSLHSWRRPGGWKSHAWHRVPFSRTCATSPFRASCSKLLLLICCWRVHRDWFKRCFICKTASSWRYKIWVTAILAHQSAIFLALAGAQAYIHSRDVALYHMVLLLRALPLCLAQCYIAHVRVSSSLDVDLYCVQSFAWRKVWSYITSK